MSLATTPKPAPNELKPNVAVSRAVLLLKSVAGAATGLAADLDFRSSLSADGLTEARARLAGILAAVTEVAEESARPDTLLAVEGADAYTAAALSAKRGNA